MFRKFIGLFALLLACSLFVLGQANEFDPNTLSDGGRTAYLTLKKVRLYAIGGVGYGGVTSEGEKALEVLIEEKNAKAAFLNLVREGTLEGGLYGLFGLRMLDCECFSDARKHYESIRFLQNDAEGVNMASGCFYFDAKSKEEKALLLSSILNKGFDQQAKLKECSRQTKGRPGDFGKCFREVSKNQ